MDFRLESFLLACKYQSYTKAAEKLCITQPAVSQHIQFLENQYGCKLLEYNNKKLTLTKAGEVFYKYAQNAKANEKIIREKLHALSQGQKPLKFAATLTIGEFTIAPVLGDFIKSFTDYNITMYVDNTETILKMLQRGDISFALVEGLFDKANYKSRLFKIADFVLIAPVTHPLCTKKKVTLEDLKDETIIIREKGSGSREVLERGLFDINYTLEHFGKIIEIGNVNVIKQIVKNGLGLSFMYRDAAIKEIKNDLLAEVKLADFAIQREFNFIYRQNNILQTNVDQIYSFFVSKLS